MTRTEFESYPSAEKRKIAEREYSKVSRQLIAELHEDGIYSDQWGPITEVHHVWSRSHCPLWHIFQRENLRPVSKVLHYLIHNKAMSDMTAQEANIMIELNEIKQQLINENISRL